MSRKRYKKRSSKGKLLDTFNGDTDALERFLLDTLKPRQYVLVTEDGKREVGWWKEVRREIYV